MRCHRWRQSRTPLRTALVLSFCWLVANPGMLRAAGAAFYNTWGDGKGEVNTYHVVEERYGELRDGHAVLVFVTEELNRDTYVKVESDATPADNRMYVVKMNRLLRFATGLYDYAAMTTVFSVADSHLGHHPFQAARATLTEQDWCGQVYQRTDLRSDGWHRDYFSYFEREGEQHDVLPAKDTDLEDNLWIWIRELDGEVIPPGGAYETRLIPSAWTLRKIHRPAELESVRIEKGIRESFTTDLGAHEAYRWSWTAAGRTTSAWIEADGAHRILGWEDSLGGHGRLAKSERLVYWQEHDNADTNVRERFRLPEYQLSEPSR